MEKRTIRDDIVAEAITRALIEHFREIGMHEYNISLTLRATAKIIEDTIGKVEVTDKERQVGERLSKHLEFNDPEAVARVYAAIRKYIQHPRLKHSMSIMYPSNMQQV